MKTPSLFQTGSKLSLAATRSSFAWLTAAVLLMAIAVSCERISGCQP